MWPLYYSCCCCCLGTVTCTIVVQLQSQHKVPSSRGLDTRAHITVVKIDSSLHQVAVIWQDSLLIFAQSDCGVTCE